MRITNGYFSKFFTYGIGNILQTGLKVFLLPIYLKQFPPSEYGLISVLTVTISVITLVGSAGMMNGLFRLYYEANEERKRKIIGTTWTWYVAVALIVSIVMFFFPVTIERLVLKSTGHAKTLHAAAILMFFSMAQQVPFNILRLKGKAVHYVVFSILQFLVEFSLKVLFINRLHWQAEGYFLSSAIASGVVFFLLVIFGSAEAGFSFDKKICKELLRLGSPYILSGAAVWVMDVSDRLVMTQFLGTQAVGIYSLSSTFANMFGILISTPIGLIIDPFFFGRAATRTDEQTRNFLAKMLKVFTFAGGTAYLIIVLCGGDAIRILVSYFGTRPAYLDAIPFIPILTLAPYLYFIATPATLAGLYIKKPEIASVLFMITAGVSLGSNLLLIPSLGILGATLSKVIAYGSMFILVYNRLGRLYPVKYDWKRIIVIMLLVAIVTAAWILIPVAEPIPSLIYKTLPLMIAFILLNAIFGIVVSKTELKTWIIRYKPIGRRSSE